MPDGIDFNDNTDDFVERIRMQASSNCLQAAFLLQTTLKVSLSTSYPPASVPGEYPHGRTWGGRDAVTVSPSTPEEIAKLGFVQIGFLRDAWYMVHLELEKQRLGLFHCYEQLKPALAKILAQGGLRVSGSKMPPPKP